MFLRKYEIYYLPKMKREIIKQIESYNGGLVDYSSLYFFLLEVFKKVGVLYAKATYRTVMAQANEKRMPIGFNELIINIIINEFRLKLLNEASVEVAQTTKEIIEAALIKGQQEGMSLNEVINNLKGSNIVTWRARLILRTELNKATNFAEQVGVDATGIATQKEWVSTRDDRTRDSHLSANGQLVEDGEPFLINGRYTMQRPGDSTNEDGTKVPASEIVNCRCVVARKVKRDSTGKVIKK